MLVGASVVATSLTLGLIIGSIAGYRIGSYKSGVRINRAERRCPGNTPCSFNAPRPMA